MDGPLVRLGNAAITEAAPAAALKMPELGGARVGVVRVTGLLFTTLLAHKPSPTIPKSKTL